MLSHPALFFPFPVSRLFSLICYDPSCKKPTEYKPLSKLGLKHIKSYKLIVSVDSSKFWTWLLRLRTEENSGKSEVSTNMHILKIKPNGNV